MIRPQAFFSLLEGNLVHAKPSRTGIILFEVTDADANRYWLVQLKHNVRIISVSEPPAQVDLTIMCQGEQLDKMARGEPLEQLRYRGDATLLEVLAQLIEPGEDLLSMRAGKRG